MSQENVEMVERAIAAINARDIRGYLACCTDDVELRTPMAALGGVYQGAVGIERFFGDIEDAGPDFRIEVDGVQAIGGDRVLVVMRASSTGRVSGIPVTSDSNNIYDIIDGKISRIRIFLDRDEALKAVGLAE